MPLQFFEAQLLEKPAPHLPDGVKIAHVGEQLVALYKVCAAPDGTMATVSIMEGIPGADAAIVDTLRHWRVRPQAGLGICTLSRFVFSISKAR
ncbi:MAG: hypothetical protein JWN44_2617 [Myxococcales bacterium]|nr:hypothetical protein [Myxococcales bacterium]